MSNETISVADAVAIQNESAQQAATLYHNWYGIYDDAMRVDSAEANRVNALVIKAVTASRKGAETLAVEINSAAAGNPESHPGVGFLPAMIGAVAAVSPIGAVALVVVLVVAAAATMILVVDRIADVVEGKKQVDASTAAVDRIAYVVNQQAAGKITPEVARAGIEAIRKEAEVAQGAGWSPTALKALAIPIAAVAALLVFGPSIAKMLDARSARAA